MKYNLACCNARKGQNYGHGDIYYSRYYGITVGQEMFLKSSKNLTVTNLFSTF